MNRKMNRTVAKAIPMLMCALLFISLFSSSAAAAPVLDITRDTGSLTIHRYAGAEPETKQPVNGAIYSAYRLMSMSTDGKLSYDEAFKDCFGSQTPEEVVGQDITALNSLMESLEGYIAEQKIGAFAVSEPTDITGKTVYRELPLGVYLVIETQTPNGVHKALSFLAGIPLTSTDGTQWVYDIDATPKQSDEIEPSPTPTPTPSPKNGFNLPKTGEDISLEFMMVCGLVMILAGIVLFTGIHIRRRKWRKKEDH